MTELLNKEQFSLHAYVLTANQVHLLITPKHADSIARVVIALGRRYVQCINTTYHRTGTLWDSRYKSSLIQAETYLLSCQRHIERNNPLRADMVQACRYLVIDFALPCAKSTRLRGNL
ncbi:MAG: transposase [Chromatiaceae bacterium]|nr:transposase [Chromatiaceae bacterium]